MRVLTTLLFPTIVAAIDLATFDGLDALTTWQWRELNDPVMGGQSEGTFVVANEGFAIFDGNCRVVPKLNAPGFCIGETTDHFGLTRKGVDATGMTHLAMTVRSTVPYTGFKVSLAADTLIPQFQSFKADVDIPSTGEWVDVTVPFSSFSNKWSSYTGEATVTCAKDPKVCIMSHLANIAQIALWAEGVEGAFHLEVKSIRAETVQAPLASPASFVAAGLAGVAEIDPSPVFIAQFKDGADGLTTWKWRETNDPVMGGQSIGNLAIADGIAVFDGDCKIVPSLKAPGFCKMETTDSFGLMPKGIDASGKTHAVLEVRSTVAYGGFKISLSADTLIPTFKSFKANFAVEATGEWMNVYVPFTSFSNKWDAATGDATVSCAQDASVCMTETNKKHFSMVGVWAEGVEGPFHLEIRSIRAENIVSTPAGASVLAAQVVAPPKDECAGPVQSNLRYGLTDYSIAEGEFPFESTSVGETLPQAICCDKKYSVYAEPRFLYELPGIDLFGTASQRSIKEGPTVFYDSVCGIPLFQAPVGRTYADWKAETTEHGWPSFRSTEVIADNVVVLDDNRVVSKCGTTIGTLLKDGTGSRFCIDLVCISGNPIVPAASTVLTVV